MPFVQAKGMKIHYRIAGQGRPLICLHGMSNHSESWSHQLEGLQDRFTVIAWDAPGYGLSQDPPQMMEHFAEFAEVLYAFVQALSLTSVCIVGHSMGAAIAVEFCAKYGDLVRSLVLSDPTRGAAALTVKENENRLKERIRLIETLGPRKMAERRVHALLAPNASESVVNRAKEIMAMVRPMGYMSVAHALYHNDQMSTYPLLRQPTLFICGELDRVTPVTESRMIQRLIVGSELHIILKTGHLCYQEDPVSFNLIVSDFFTSSSKLEKS